MLTCTFDKSVICVLTGILAPVTDDTYLQASIAPVVTVLCSLLDIDVTFLSHSSDVSGTMATRTSMSIVQDGSLQLKVMTSKYEKAKLLSIQDLRTEWKQGMKVPIDLITDRFSQMKTGNQDVVVSPGVTEEQCDKLHINLNGIDSNYSSKITTKEHLNQVGDLVSWMKTHSVYTPYSFSVQKCNKVSCCGVMRTPIEFRDLVMQRQPTPQPDKNWDGHFLRRDDALNQAKMTLMQSLI